ncbi:DUF4252 domain-containing protein [Pseudofulvibacter geojedonensis]|uniref:DUF4252 domain-containing protein n=1 Tax=Pseudofulvibacter geojedonensis TaxID=1123758 RepID=A0ABW3HZL3_9FLAO
MQLLQKILVTIIVGFLLTSCNQEPTLQKYYVENEKKDGFGIFDIPKGMIGLEESKLSPQQKKAYQSVEKLNILAFKKTEANAETYKAETSKVKSLLKNDSYTELLKFKDKNTNAVVKYIGTETAIDEVIIFGSDNKIGFGIVRVLGSDMKPEDMVTLIDAMRTANVDGTQLKEIAKFFQ